MKYFDEYVFNYDMNDPEINYKYHHSYRVMEASELIAKSINMNETDIHLAKVIGLLHDVGRFEQDKLYNSFKDDKMDHGDYGVKVLNETNILDQTGIDESDYDVVRKAVKNHNKFQIEPNLTERELLFSKIARDADKLDILYVLGNEKYATLLRQDDNEISKIQEDCFFNHQVANRKNSKSSNDGLVQTFCYIYDINFKKTLKLVYENKYYDKIYERINRKDIFKKYLDYANEYMKERID